MHRAFKALVLSAATILGVLGFASESLGQYRLVTVFVFSDIPVSRQLLDRAEQRAQKIFSISGVDILWIDCTRSNASDDDRDPACTKRYGPDDFVLRITSHVSTVSSDAFGVAFLGSDGRGRYADVFWNRAQELGATSRPGRRPNPRKRYGARVGPSAIGPELSLGDWLLMRARWGNDELRCLDMGTLVFLPEQGKRMRARIVDSSSARISSGTR